MAEQIAGSLGSELLARARQLFYGLPKATCQATLGILAGCGASLFGVEIDGVVCHGKALLQNLLGGLSLD